MPLKPMLSGVAIALVFIAFVPYIVRILRGHVRPHVFSWIIWGSTTFLVFLAQLADGGGAGAWPVGVSGLITVLIAVLAWRARADTSITRADCGFLALALSALPLWWLTDDPLWAVVVLTTVDALGFGPTMGRAWRDPHAESLLFFGLFALRNALVIAALEHHSPTTVLFPAVIGVACVVLMAVLVHRRRVLASRAGG